MNKSYVNPSSTSTVILERKGKVCLIKRKNNPFKGYFAFPGGFLENGKENLEQAAVREIEEETNYHIKLKNLNLLMVNSEVDRDPRGHVIDHVYYTSKFSGKGKAKDDASSDDAPGILYWKNINEVKKIKLAFDHSKVFDFYLKTKQNRGIK
jgi:8-oxo-dGTP diphosphatase